jgi:hypothetical protein
VSLKVHRRLTKSHSATPCVVIAGVIYALASKPAIVVPIAAWDVAVVLFGEFEARLKLHE